VCVGCYMVFRQVSGVLLRILGEVGRSLRPAYGVPVSVSRSHLTRLLTDTVEGLGSLLTASHPRRVTNFPPPCVTLVSVLPII
jgi:hypothetical protein